MVSLDEIKYTANRIEVILNNTESDDEKVVSTIILNNLKQIISQLDGIEKSPQWNEIKQQFIKKDE